MNFRKWVLRFCEKLLSMLISSQWNIEKKTIHNLTRSLCKVVPQVSTQFMTTLRSTRSISPASTTSASTLLISVVSLEEKPHCLLWPFILCKCSISIKYPRWIKRNYHASLAKYIKATVETLSTIMTCTPWTSFKWAIFSSRKGTFWFSLNWVNLML